MERVEGWWEVGAGMRVGRTRAIFDFVWVVFLLGTVLRNN